MKGEIWKEIPGFPNVFASNLGRIKRPYKRGRTHFIKGSVNRHGYRVTSLYSNGKRQQFHRLVALAFIPNPEGKPFIDHINGDRCDNRVDNLRWCTNKENMNYPLALANMSESIKRRSKDILHKRLTGNKCNAEREVCQLSITGELLKIHSSIANAARFLGDYSYNSKITSVCKGKSQRKSAYGYKWCYHFGIDVGLLTLIL